MSDRAQNIPTTADAERWIGPDHFLCKGKVWVLKGLIVKESKYKESKYAED